jgi:hypothetical protein
MCNVQKRGYLDIQQCANLFRELNSYRTLPSIADEDIEAIFYALDDSGDFKVSLATHLALFFLIMMMLYNSSFQKLPWVYTEKTLECCS